MEIEKKSEIMITEHSNKIPFYNNKTIINLDCLEKLNLLFLYFTSTGVNLLMHFFGNVAVLEIDLYVTRRGKVN